MILAIVKYNALSDKIEESFISLTFIPVIIDTTGLTIIASAKIVAKETETQNIL